MLFESAVINEYLDETTGQPLHPKDPLQKALERAWIEFGSSVLMEQYGMTMAIDPAEHEEQKTEYFESLEKLEAILGAGPFFRGRDFGLVDAGRLQRTDDRLVPRGRKPALLRAAKAC